MRDDRETSALARKVPRHLRFTIEAQMETDEIQALAKVDIQALDKR